MGLLTYIAEKANASVATKHPTVKQDYIAYTSGSNKTYSNTYNTYLQTVESIDKAVRIICSVASMAKFVVSKDMNGTLKPLKIKNIDLAFNINEQDSQGDFLSLVFSSVFTQGASIVIAEQNSKTKFVNFYAYDPSKFMLDATENNMISMFNYTSLGGTIVPFKPEDVVYIAPRVDPSNLVYATSRLKPLNDLLILQSELMAQQKAFYASGGKNSAIVSPKEPMGEDKAKQLKTAFDTFLQTPATKTLFLNTDVSVDVMSNAQSPSQIMEALIKINNLVIEQFGIPAYLYGNYSGYVNDAAVVTASKIFFQVQLKPIFNSIAFQMTKYFRNTLGIQNAVVSFDFNDVEILEDSLDTKIENASKLYKLGIMSMNEARVAAELEPLTDEAANRHWVPAYLTSSMPISIEQFDETVAKIFEGQGVQTNTPDPLASSGTTGGTDNQSKITDSTGGQGNTG